MLLSPLFGWLGDRCRAGRWSALAVIVWSLASGGSGLAAGFVMLLLTRCLVGRRRGGLRAGRPVHALGPVPGRTPRQGHVLVLPGHPGRQRPRVRRRRAGGRDRLRWRGAFYGRRPTGARARPALLLHARTRPGRTSQTADACEARSRLTWRPAGADRRSSPSSLLPA